MLSPLEIIVEEIGVEQCLDKSGNPSCSEHIVKLSQCYHIYHIR